MKQFIILITLVILAVGNTALTQSASASKIETIAATKELDIFTKLFCFHENNYFFVNGSKFNLQVSIFDAEKKLIAKLPIEKPDSVKSYHYHGAYYFQNEICVFFTGVKKGMTKKHRGLFVWKFDMDLMDFTRPTLLGEFPVYTSNHRTVIRVSENKKYLAVVAEPKSLGDDYSYSIAIYNDQLEPLLFEAGVEGNFSDNCAFTDASISNEGNLLMLFKENYEIFTLPCFQSASDHMNYIQYSASGTKSQYSFVDEKRKILHCRFVEEEGAEFIFISWFYTDNTKRVGISMIDPDNNKETIIYEFAPEILEPYVECQGYDRFSDDTERKNLLSDSKVNAFIDLIDVFDTDGKTYFLLEKRTPVRIKNGNQPYYTDIAGDIFLIEPLEGIVKKIERNVVSYATPRGVIHRIDEKSLELHYYSSPFESGEKIRVSGSAMSAFSEYVRPADLYFFRTVIDFETYEIKSTELVPVDSENYFIRVSPMTALVSSQAVITFGWVGSDLHAIDLSIFE